MATTRDRRGPGRGSSPAACSEMLNDGMLTLLLSVGHQTACSTRWPATGPATSAEIAQAAGLDERYVREWLAGMTVGGDRRARPRAGTLRAAARARGLPDPRRRPGQPRLLRPVRRAVRRARAAGVDCFRHGGGVRYSAMPRFQALQAEESAQIHDGGLIDVTLPLVHGLADRLRTGIDVLDIGCGHGHAVNLIADAFPSSRVTGIDISEQGIAAAPRGG